jgi:catecholate siderophore receptor
VYASFSEAFMPRAGEQLSSLTSSVAAFEPEKFTNVELGAKWDIRPDLTATAAIYKLDRSNVLLSNFPIFGESLLIEGDAQTSKGLELGLSGKITPTWSVFGGYAYQSAELTREGNSTVLNGAKLPHVPKHAWSLWNRFDLDSRWAMGLGVSRRSAITASIANPTVLPGYTRVDTALFYKFNNQYQLQANLENLLNKEYYASAHSNNNITPGSPRAVRVTLNAKF